MSESNETTLYTIPQIAAMLGRPPVTIRQVAQRNGIGRKLGRDRLLTAEDVETLRKLLHDRSGRPHKTQNNDSNSSGDK